MALPDNGLNGFIPFPAGERMTLPWPEAPLPEAYVSAYVEGSEEPLVGVEALLEEIHITCGEADADVAVRSGPGRYEAAIRQNDIYRTTLIDAVGVLEILGHIGGVPGNVLVQDDADDLLTFVDLVNLVGPDGVARNWVQELEWGESIDQPVPDFRALLFRTLDDGSSLSPFMEASPFNTEGDGFGALIRPGKIMRFQTVVEEIFHLLMDGMIDEVDPASNADGIVVTGRGVGSELLDRQVEEAREYGAPTPGPGPLEGGNLAGVMQTMLFDWGQPSNPDAAQPGWPYWFLWSISTYNVPNFSGQIFADVDMPPAYLNLSDQWLPKGSLLQGLLKLAQDIAWDLRYFKGPTNEPWRLVLYRPPREKVQQVRDGLLPPDKIVNAGAAVVAGELSYESISAFTISRVDVRNKIKVFYTDPVTGVASITVTDPVSIAKYGLRYMELDMTEAAGLDSAAEVGEFALAALSDLAEPWALIGMVLPFVWDVTLHQVWQIKANAEHHNVDQFMSVLAYRHNIAIDKESTTLTFRGKPSGSVDEWLRREGSGPTEEGSGGSVGFSKLAITHPDGPGDCIPENPAVRVMLEWALDVPDPENYSIYMDVFLNGAVLFDPNPSPFPGAGEHFVTDILVLVEDPADPYDIEHRFNIWAEITRLSDGVVVGYGQSEQTFRYLLCRSPF